MNVIVNGENYQTTAKTVGQLISELGYPKSEVATALDGNFLSVIKRSEALLSENCKIEIVTPHPGG